MITYTYTKKVYYYIHGVFSNNQMLDFAEKHDHIRLYVSDLVSNLLFAIYYRHAS